MADAMRRERFLGECQRRFGISEDGNLEDVLIWMIWADTFVDEARSFLDDDISDIVTEKATEAENAFKKTYKYEYK